MVIKDKELTMSRYKVQNWSEYNKSLINRGSLTLWISEDAMKKWQATREKQTLGPPRLYSDDAILCLMMVKWFITCLIVSLSVLSLASLDRWD